MYQSGDAAEQVVRIGLEGAEFALKVTGAAARNIAAALYVVLKDQKKTKGRARIEAMLREKRPLKVYTIKKTDCPEFARQARGYGILYAPIPVRKKDDTVDILVFEDDAARANRIVERFHLTVVDTSAIQESIERSRGERGGKAAVPGMEPAAREGRGRKDSPGSRDGRQADLSKAGGDRQTDSQEAGDDSLLEELLGPPAQKGTAQPEPSVAEPPEPSAVEPPDLSAAERPGFSGMGPPDPLGPEQPAAAGVELPDPLGPERPGYSGLERPGSSGPERAEPPGPEQAGPFGQAAEKSPPSASISGNSSRSARGTSDGTEKPSVRRELWEIQVRQKQEKAVEAAQRAEPPAVEKKAGQRTTPHRQPKNRKKADRKRGRSR